MGYKVLSRILHRDCQCYIIELELLCWTPKFVAAGQTHKLDLYFFIQSLLVSLMLGCY